MELTGGVWICAINGNRAPDVLARLGSTSAIPAPGQARTGRIAELSVLSMSVRPGEILLLVEQVYALHLIAWLRETLRDL